MEEFFVSILEQLDDLEVDYAHVDGKMYYATPEDHAKAQDVFALYTHLLSDSIERQIKQNDNKVYLVSPIGAFNKELVEHSIVCFNMKDAESNKNFCNGIHLNMKYDIHAVKTFNVSADPTPLT